MGLELGPRPSVDLEQLLSLPPTSKQHKRVREPPPLPTHLLDP